MGAIVLFAFTLPIDLPSQLQGYPTPVIIAINIALALILTLLVLFVIRIIRVGQRLRSVSREGRRISAADQDPLPLTSFRRNGVPGDPLNVRVVASEAQLGAAFANAGWYRAFPIIPQADTLLYVVR